MSVLHIPARLFDGIEDNEMMVCVFCDQSTSLRYCALCHEYKGLMTVKDWEAYTGETWED